MLHHPIGRLRIAGLVEGSSFLLLLFIAMPLKYLVGRPEAVEIIGWIHGLLFIILCVAIVAAVVQARLAARLAILAFVASLIPFGPFIIDPRLKREQASLDETTGT